VLAGGRHRQLWGVTKLDGKKGTQKKMWFSMEKLSAPRARKTGERTSKETEKKEKVKKETGETEPSKE